LWRSTFPVYITPRELEELICPDFDKKRALQQILPVDVTQADIVYYEACKANLFAATKRQCVAVPKMDQTIFERFKRYYEKIIVPELEELLVDFEYHYNVWFNHLTKEQQEEMQKVYDNACDDYGMFDKDHPSLYDRHVNVFCKAEKQQNDGDKPAKNRCISALNDVNKFVLGPLVFASEQYFKKYKGYCGGKSWEKLGKIFDKWKTLGLNVIGSDISGWDRSQNYQIKELIHHGLYRMFEGKLHHVSKEVYAQHAYANYTRMDIADTIGNSFGYVIILGNVFSGSNDTTAFNTMTNVIINRFICEELLMLSIDEYDLLCKGDDSEVAIPNRISKNQVIEAYSTVFVDPKVLKSTQLYPTIEHGLGLTCKFIRFGETTDIDFCSTEVFYCEYCKQHKITRQLKRFLSFTPYSNRILLLPNKLKNVYLKQLGISNEFWMKGLPIFRALNSHLMVGPNSAIHNSMLKPKNSKILNADEIKWVNAYLKDDDEDTQKISNELIDQLFGKNEHYSMAARTQNLCSHCHISYRDMLTSKYGITNDDIKSIEDDILNATDFYYSHSLCQLYINMDDYKKSLII
jgi:hypothetical protein